MKPSPRRCITVLYPNTPGVTFDFDYYLEHHATLIHRLYGDSIAKLELRRGAATPVGSPAPYVAIINIWIADQEAFDSAGVKHGATLIADVPNFTNTMPTIQIDEIVE
ncbi:MAG TPA: EthD family reductase [Steroidobacteraceae bacterium]|nr:EthD family reductase [Steroidobacteraceae bacterium]